MLLQLPAESRFVRKYNPLEDWNWDKEVQSQILRQLDSISCKLSNMFREKGKPKAKPGKQMQPDYVEKAKNQLEKERQARKNIKYDVAEMEAFWKNRNPKATFLGGESGKNMDR